MESLQARQTVSDNSLLLSEWNTEKNVSITPNELLLHSGKKVWWVCKKGHEWEDSVNHRSRGRACPYCSGKRVLIGFNDITTTHPIVAAEWNYEKNNPLLPTQFTAGSTKKVWWCCKCHHEWESVIESRTKGTGCPYCTNRKVLIGFNDLATTNPGVAKEWNYERNGDLLPTMVTYGSKKQVWWQCEAGHEWKATINDRTTMGCPYCSRHRVVSGETDLSSVSPQLAKEWNYKKNGQLVPELIAVSSNKKVWWICENSHEWEASVSNRNRGDRCPYCANKKLLSGYNDLKTRFPDLIQEWDYEKNGDLCPDRILASSNERVWWLCKFGHSWKASIQHRRYGHGCPICSHRNKTSFPEQVIFYYIHKQYPDAINSYTEIFTNERTSMELDIFIPTLQVGIEYDGEPWHQTTDHLERELKKYNICKQKGVRLIRIKENEEHNEKVTCDILIHVSKSRSTQKYSQLFDALKEYIPFEQTIDIKHDRVFIQEQYIISYIDNSFVIQYPSVAAEWHPTRNGKLKPEMFLPGSNQLAWWICDKGHEWEAAIESRTKYAAGCPVCANLKIIPGTNDISTTHPDIAKEWNTEKNKALKPSDVCAGTMKKVWWICNRGHEWQAVIASRCKGIGCPICSNKRILKGFNDLISTNPSLAQEWNYKKNTDISPDQVTEHSGKRVWWICEKGHEWEATINHRSQGTGCPICSNRKVLIGYNDFQSLYPQLAKEWNYKKNGNLKPSDITPSAGKKIWWQCAFGHEWEAYIYNRIHGSSCPICYANSRRK